MAPSRRHTRRRFLMGTGAGLAAAPAHAARLAEMRTRWQAWREGLDAWRPDAPGPVKPWL